MFYIWLCLCLLFAAVLLYFAMTSRTAFPGLFLNVIMYAISCVCLIYAFFVRLRKIARAPQRLDLNLMHLATKMTICFSVALFSTLFSVLIPLFILAVTKNLYIFVLLFVALPLLDKCVNSFCLLCTLPKAKPLYDQIFGSLHGSVVNRLLLLHRNSGDSRNSVMLSSISHSDSES